MARLDFTATNILTASELDELARQATSNVLAAGKPTGTAEGETIAVTDNDRFNYWNGSAWVRGTNWAATGRTWVAGTSSPGAVNDGVSAAFNWSVSPDADSFYTGFSGSDYYFTIPSGLDGVYAITCRIKWLASWTPAPGDLIEILIDTGASESYAFPGAANAAVFMGAVPAIALAAGDTIAVRATQESGSAKTVDQADITIIRLCA